MRRICILFLTLVLLTAVVPACTNTDKVGPDKRTTFIKLYEKGGDFSVQAAEVLSDGYLVGVNLETKLNDNTIYTSAYVFKTDFLGNLAGKEVIIDSASIKCIKVLDDGGYLILGDMIHLNPAALNTADKVVTKALITRMDNNLNITASATFFDPSSRLTDFHGTGVTLNQAGDVITIGNKAPSATGSFNSAYVVAYKPDLGDTLWTRPFTLIDQDYSNAKNAYITPNDQVLFASTIDKINLSATTGYLTIPLVKQKSAFDAYNYFGVTISQNRLQASEIIEGFSGYGIVGTFTDGQGNGGNMFFIRATVTGAVEDNTVQVFDGLAGPVAFSLNGIPASTSDDVGTAISPTPEGGYIIGGSLETVVGRGNGKKDIWLIKLDASGTVLWNKNYGGTGDETVNSIRTLSDGSYLVAGGAEANGLTAGYIMRIDANGEIKN